MNEPIPNNNEFEAAEQALRKLGSNLWFGGLSEEWKDFMRSHTVEQFDNYEISMEQAAANLIQVYQELVSKNPEILSQNPWSLLLKND